MHLFFNHLRDFDRLKKSDLVSYITFNRKPLVQLVLFLNVLRNKSH